MMLTSIGFEAKPMAAPQVIPPHLQIDEFQQPLLVLLCRRSDSANVKPLHGYCFHLLRQCLLLINKQENSGFENGFPR